MKRKLLSALLALSLTFSLSAAPAAALTLDEARQLLRDHYVDQIPESILSLDSLERLLEALGDPYTYYMTAEQYSVHRLRQRRDPGGRGHHGADRL